MEEKQVLRNAVIIKHVQQIRESMPRIGTRKLKHMLDDLLASHGIRIGRDGLFELLSEYGLLVRRRKKRKIITTDSDHPFKKYPNLIRSFVASGPNQLWVSDITYVALTNSYCYLSMVTDAYSRKILGFRLHGSLQKEGPLTALRMAQQSSPRPVAQRLIHHSDRGLQYCCKEYTDLLVRSGITISMTEKGDPYENAIAERINGILKIEFGLNRTFKNYQDASEAVDAAVRTYNEQRPHNSLGYRTPQDVHLTGLSEPKRI